MKSWLSLTLLLAVESSWIRTIVGWFAPAVVWVVDLLQRRGFLTTWESKTSMLCLVVSSLCLLWARRIHKRACPKELTEVDEASRRIRLAAFKRVAVTLAIQSQAEESKYLKRKLMLRTRLLGCFSREEQIRVVDAFVAAAAGAQEDGDRTLNVFKQSLDDVEDRLNGLYPKAQLICLILVILYLAGIVMGYSVLALRCLR